MNRMLDPADETDADVNWNDQCKINTFSKLNQRLQNRTRSLKDRSLEKECMEDIVAELELADENESLFYKVGDAFVLLPFDEVQERLEMEQSQVNEEVSKLETEISELNNDMEELKKDLYKKFGKAINLET
ncbi:unnamed protein product [Pneumocystis jirovecii]|uniref:Prefoldin subunit 4 n=2 Tax=Pneumocystis jirovecii TaxID=42068 RepID=L0PE66_PNEJI|nr:uncharacterized protein T551_02158 [Pneumocystis jirovecii RU7]KTW29542.1 hypothetical protein T551_02158 [Pneumocystis jirovecii RU7]CCJ30706.1 unnamed protein product [Pneumocystis jirovecii]